jgi:hypothetical protein
VIHAHPFAAKMLKIAPESTPDIKHETQIEGLQMPSVRALNVKQALPPHGLEPAETQGIVLAFG